MNAAQRQRAYRERHKDNPDFVARRRATVNRSRLRMRDTATYKASRLEISRRRWADPDTRAAWKAAIKKFRAEHPEMVRAHSAVKYALKVGNLFRPTACSDCGVTPAPRIDGRSSLQAHHHNGYEAKLDVIWLCVACHKRLHRKAA